MLAVLLTACSNVGEDNLADGNTKFLASEDVHICILENIPFEIINQRQQEVVQGSTVSFVFKNNTRLWYMIAPGAVSEPSDNEGEIQIREENYMDYRILTKSRPAGDIYSIEAYKGGVSAVLYSLKAEDLNGARKFISEFINVVERQKEC